MRPGEVSPNLDVTDATAMGVIRVLSLASLVQIKLTAYRDKDRTHLRALIGVGLVDRGWVDRLPKTLGERLTHILDTPDG